MYVRRPFEIRLLRPAAAIPWALTLLALPLAASGQTGPAQSGHPTGPGSGAAAAGSDQKPANSPAGRVITIITPEEGEKFVRILPSPEVKSFSELPDRFLDTRTTITIPNSAGKSPRIAVDNVKSGNTAVVPVPKDKDTVQLHPIDFRFVHRLEVKVTYDGKPVQVAQVTLDSGDKSLRTSLIDASKQGVAIFEDVPAGKARVTVMYGDKLTQTQDVPIASDHPGGYVTVPIAVSNKVPTLDANSPAQAAAPAASGNAGQVPSGPGAAPSGATPPPPAQSGGIASLVGTVIGLAVAGGGIYLLYRWAQSGGMAATLKKAGIEVSGPPPPSDAGTPWAPSASAPPVVTDPTLCPFCGQKKDAGGGCACAVATGGAPGAAVAAPAGVRSQPRLIATMGVYSGSIFPVTGNGSGNGITLGREPTNTVSLSNDTTVSRRHASIRAEGGGYVVADEGSSNGVYVNGVKIAGAQRLNPGDEIAIGQTRFRFEL